MAKVITLSDGWAFARIPGGDRSPVSLPHSPVEATIDGHDHWMGVCEYTRSVRIPALEPGSRCALHIGAAMHTAEVRVDDVVVGTHAGGYLPFEVDLTPVLADGLEHALAIRVDNRDNPDVPPGKPFADLDFCWYGGLYRGAELRLYPPVHITDPVAANIVAGGGLFVRTLSASAEKAVIAVKVHARNTSGQRRSVRTSCSLRLGGEEQVRFGSELRELPAGGETHFEMEVEVPYPALWSPASPQLYDLVAELRDAAGMRVDRRSERIGLRRIHFSRSGGLVLNGAPLRPRGTNRHQEYPFAGYAAPPAAQRRDARRIKEAGFDFVRLSHYPQDPSFLSACDELGILVMNCIPGWQFIGGDAFRENSYTNARDLIRRDRNHASIVLWELSLNETQMDEAYMARMHAIGHEEYPGDQMFTAGWIDRYDVYLHSRQHGEIHRWRNGDKALVIAEYGDWEFYAANEGFDQKTGAGVHAAWSNSRHFRGEGERALLQQAHNHTLALNDTLLSPAALCGQWAVFDYARGYHPLRAAVGVMDIHRVPKFSYHFYRSQRDATDEGSGWSGGAEVFIASHWTAQSDLRLTVFSNCDEVELSLNGVKLARKKPDVTWMTQYLPHPPFVFETAAFVPGTLEATGFIDGCPVATHRVATPGQAEAVELTADEPASGEQDLIFAHARMVDRDGNLCVSDASLVEFNVSGPAVIVGPVRVLAEAGIASVLVRCSAQPGRLGIAARANINGRLHTAEMHVVRAPLYPSPEANTELAGAGGPA